jgi:hypothetical protein
MMMRTMTAAALTACFLLLAACGDKPQTAGSKKADAAPWEGAQAAFSDKGWKTGDQTSWEAQMRNRAQSQNEYTRTAPGQK